MLSFNHRLAKEGREAVGILQSKSCASKRSEAWRYTFHANGKDYVGHGAPGTGNQPCDVSQPGDQLFLTYLPTDPNVSTPARKVSSDYLIAFLSACCLFPLLVWGNKEQTKFWQKRKQSGM